MWWKRKDLARNVGAMMKIQIDAEAVIANPHPEWAEWIKEEIQDVLRSYNGHAVSVKLTEQHD